jgi:hypothetical protein
MKKLLLVCLIAMTNLVFAERITFPTPNSAGKKPVKLSENTEFFSNVISEMDLEKIAIQGQNFTALNLDGYVFSGEIGDPKLPGKARLLNVSKGTTINVRVLSSEYVDISLNSKGFTNPLMPVEPPHRKSATEPPALVKNQEAYSQTSFNQRDLVDLTHFGIMRDRELFRLNINPIQYLPSENIIRVFYHIEFEVIYTEGAPLPKSNPSKAPIYKVVAHRLFEDSDLQKLLQWKTDQGFDVQVAWYDYSGGTSGTAATEFRINLKNYLQELYSNLDTRPDYILFVGDHQQIPAYPSALPYDWWGLDNDHITDLYYVTYDPDGFLPDIPYGRLPHQTVQTLNNHIEKILATDQMTGNLDHFTRAVGIAGSEANTRWRAQADVTVDYAANHYFNSSNGITSTTIKNPLSNSDATIIQPSRNAINAGAIFVNYSAHCNWDRWDDNVLRPASAHQLTNTGMYPLMIGNCCISAGFDRSECVGEALVRGEQKGASTYIGGTNSTYWYEDFAWSIGPMTMSQGQNPHTATLETTGLGVYDRLFHPNYNERANDMYQIISYGNKGVFLGTSNSGLARMERYYWEIYHVFGDPSMVPSFGFPQVMPADYKDSIVFTEQNLVIHAVPHARVGFTFDGELLASAKADETGIATLYFAEELSLGEAKLVITARNYSPHVAPITILRYPSSIQKPLPEQAGFDVMIRGNGQLHAQINAKTPSRATIRLVNLLGHSVGTIVSNGAVNAGQNDFYFDMNHLPKGLYICTYFDGHRAVSQKVVW